MKNSYLSVIGLVSCTLLSSCGWMGEKKESSEALFVIVNVLDKKYFEDCRIKGSINLSMDELVPYAQKNWNKETEIVVYCANYKCTASGESVKALKEAGFNNAWAYEGGIAEWKQLGYPVEGICKSGYLADYAKPEGYENEAGTPVISAQELKQKFDKFIQ
jgi:rhodanese-related sulfurtransferase